MKEILCLFLCVVSGFCYSQHWFFCVKPILGTPIASFQRFDKVVYDSEINYSNGAKPSTISFSDNIKLNLQYNIDLFADFYRINPKWKIGAGIGVYNGQRVFLKSQYIEQTSQQVWNNEIILGNAQQSHSASLGFVDFNTYALATRRLNYSINANKNMIQSISLGGGFAKNKKNDMTLDIYYWGLFVFETYKSHNYFPFFLFRYEFEFLTPKGKSLFNCSVSYQQGIFKVAQLTHYDIYNSGTFDYQRAFTRGSSLGVSISKPFNLKQSN
jgi:hypothetical protein